MRTAVILLFCFSALFVAGCISRQPEAIVGEPALIEEGDTVLISYVERVKDTGELVATSHEELASDPKTPKAPGYIEADSYGPINLTVGSGLMPYLERALVGVRVGEEKEVFIPPQEAYGVPLKELIRVIPRVAVLQKIEEIPISQFRARYNSTPDVGEYIELPLWRARVIEVTNESIAIRNEPQEDSVIKTSYGPAKVNTNSTHVIAVLTPEVNSYVDTPFGPARVIDYDDVTITLDHNHPLAGKTLSFLARVEGIEKSK